MQTCHVEPRTLGTREDAILLSLGDGPVDMGLEHRIGHTAKGVVRLDILLNRLAARGH